MNMEDEFDIDLSKTYIYEGNEYIMTGRIAERTKDAAPERPTRRSRRPRPVVDEPDRDIMVEIRPVPKHKTIAGVPSTLKWVNLSELFEVVHLLDDDEIVTE